MKWFWSKYKTGLLLIILPLIAIIVLSKVVDAIWYVAVVFHSWTGGGEWLKYAFFGLFLAVPFLIGWIAARRYFIHLLGKIFSFFGAGWVAKSILTEDYLDKIKRGEYKVVMFEVCSCQNSSWKIGVVVNVFKKENVEYSLILEMTPPLPSGPFWIKRTSEVTILSQDFLLKHLLMTTLSLGLNLPLEKNEQSNSR